MKRKLARSAMITVVTAACTAACAMGADLFKRSITSPNINVTQPMLTVREYEKGHVKHQGMLEPNSKAAKRLQAIIDGSGWRPSLVTYAPTLHFRPESGPGFTIDVGPTHAVASFETLGLMRQKVRTIKEEEYQALLLDFYASAEPILKQRKRGSKPE
jgi:hypothetical protein